MKCDVKETVTEGLPYVIVRCNRASTFAGFLKDQDGQEVTLTNARRLWYWSGAATLSQLAMEGVKNPDKCKFPVEVSTVILTDAIEIIAVTEAAQQNIAEVPVWQK